MELNLSCPHGMGERGMGLACGQVYTQTHTRVYVRLLFVAAIILEFWPYRMTVGHYIDGPIHSEISWHFIIFYGTLPLGHLYHAQACLTNKVEVV